MWGARDLLRGIADVIKWPFERIGWAIERGVLWPLQDRLGPAWDGPVRIAGIALVAVAALGAGVAGLLWAAPDHGNNTTKLSAVPLSVPPVVAPVKVASDPDRSTLRGTALSFSPSTSQPSKESVTQATESKPVETPATAETTEAAPAETPAATPAKGAQPVGPPSIKSVANRFANAFVLYETGVESDKVRAAFHATATPTLARSLLGRPPRLPANVKVPKAKVLNVVLGPSHNGVYTMSVSLLRVGLTSEIRLDMEKDKTGNWRVTNVLG